MSGGEQQMVPCCVAWFLTGAGDLLQRCTEGNGRACGARVGALWGHLVRKYFTGEVASGLVRVLEGMRRDMREAFQKPRCRDRSGLTSSSDAWEDALCGDQETEGQGHCILVKVICF